MGSGGPNPLGRPSIPKTFRVDFPDIEISGSDFETLRSYWNSIYNSEYEKAKNLYRENAEPIDPGDFLKYKGKTRKFRKLGK